MRTNQAKATKNAAAKIVIAGHGKLVQTGTLRYEVLKVLAAVKTVEDAYKVPFKYNGEERYIHSRDIRFAVRKGFIKLN